MKIKTETTGQGQKYQKAASKPTGKQKQNAAMQDVKHRDSDKIRLRTYKAKLQ